MRKESKDIRFASILENSKSFEITDITKERGVIFFKINGYKYATYGDTLVNENSAFYKSPPMWIFAEKLDSPQTIVNEEKFDENYNLFSKHRAALIKIVFLQAFNKLNKEGEEAFLSYIDKHFDVIPDFDSKGVQWLLKRLEES